MHYASSANIQCHPAANPCPAGGNYVSSLFYILGQLAGIELKTFDLCRTNQYTVRDSKAMRLCERKSD